MASAIQPQAKLDDAHRHSKGCSPPLSPLSSSPPVLTQCRQHATGVLVSPSTYLVCWWIVVCFHLATAVFVLLAGIVHVILSIDAFHRATSAILIPVQLKRITGLSYLVVALLHFAAVARMVRQSIRARQLILRMEPIATKPSVNVANHERQSSFAAARRVYHTLLRTQARILGPDGYFGIHGPLFAWSLLLREVVEVLMQTYQLWSLSYNISRSWLNGFAVAAVVVNCFSIPLVNLVFHSREDTRRLMHLVLDMVLDFVGAVLVSVLLMVPYSLQFDWSSSVIPAKLMLDDVWFAIAVAESRQMMVVSYLDFFASLLPQYSIYSCLRLLKRLVRRKFGSQATHASAIAPGPADPRRTVRETVKISGGTMVASNYFATRDALEKQSRSTRVVSACIAAWGVMVLALHIHANYMGNQATHPGCQLYVRPWFATNVSCSVMRTNCYRWNTSGAAHDLAQILDPLERTGLTKIVFAHCPALIVPSNLVEFPSIGTMEIFNSTVVDWPSTAAIRQLTHGLLSDIYFTNSDVATIPPGLLHSELPQSLNKIAFTNCSIAELPEDIGVLWAESRMQRLGLEHTRVRSIPASFGRLKQLRRLWIIDSLVESFPDDMFTSSRFSSIRLSGLPLQQLPNTVGNTADLKELVAEYTNVSSLPSWAVAWLESHSSISDKHVRSFYGSPVCSNVTAHVVRWRICDRDLQSQHGDISPEVFNDRYPV